MSDKQNEGAVELASTLEALVNLLYLIRIDRHDPDRVLKWVEMADRQSKRLESILQYQRLPLNSVNSRIEN